MHVGAGLTTPSAGLVSAVAAGVFNPGFVALPFNCPTGNCSFTQPYSTLGYCASCKDISHSIEVIPWNHTELINTTDTDGSTYLANYSSQAINTTLPSGLHTFYDPAGDDPGDERWLVMGFGGEGLELLLSATDQTQSGTKVSDSHVFAYYAGLVDMSDTSCPENLRTSWGCQGPRAASCSLDLCTKTYTADVKEGKLHENLVSTSTVWNDGVTSCLADDCASHVGYLTQADLTCLNLDQKSDLRRIGYTFSDDDYWIPYNVSVDVTTGAFVEMRPIDYTGPPTLSKEQKSIVPADCIYQVFDTSYSGIDSYITTYFEGYVQPYGNGHAWYGDSQFLAIFNNSIMNMDSITHIMDNVAESITIYMRQHGNSNYSKSVSGSATTAATCIAVRWEWLAFPAVVVMVTAMFLIATLVKTELDEDDKTYRGWKSSVLPLVFHSWDGVKEKQSQHEDMPLQRKEMDQAAQKLRVRLKGTGVSIEMQ